MSGDAGSEATGIVAGLFASAKNRRRSQPVGIAEKIGRDSAQLKGLVSKNILRLEKRRIDRLPQLPPRVNIDFELTPDTADLPCRN